MNVREIRERVEAELQYAPDVQAYRRDIRRLISDEYALLSEEHDWPWLMRTEPLWVWPDLVIDNGDLSATASRTFTCPVSVVSGWLPDPDRSQVGVALVYDAWNGAEFGLVDPELRDAANGNWEWAPFTVEHVVFDTTKVGTELEFWLDARCVMTGAVSAQAGDFVLKFKRYRVPPRCSQVVRIRGADRRELVPLTWEQAAARQLDQDSQGTPTCYLPDGGADVRIPTTATGFSPGDGMQLYDDPPYGSPPFGVAVGGVGTVPVGSYRIRVAWLRAGRWGPPSEEVLVTVSAPAQLQFSGLPVYPSDDYGARLGIWLARDEGPWLLAAVMVDANVASYNLTAWSNDTGSTPFARVRWEDVAHRGRVQYLRLWPRPTEPERLVMEYRATPRTLEDDLDEPEFDALYHPLLVWRVVLRLLHRHEGDAAFRRALVQHDRVLSLMLRRYGIDARHRIRAGQVDAHRTARSPVRGVTWGG